MFDKLRLSPYYLNTRRLELVTGVELPIAAQISLARNSDLRVVAMRETARSAERLLKSGRIPNLTSQSPIPADGDCLMGVVWGVFTFRGASLALRREREGKPFENASFHACIPLGDRDYEFSGQLINDHFYSASSPGMLTGKRRMLVAGQFQFNGTSVEVFPYIIGNVIEGMGLPMPWASSIRVHPGSIDAFRRINGRIVSKPELAAVRLLPEENVKNAFAEIIGEYFVSKDWGGERSDLFTSRLTVDGQPTTAAFIFKGPSVSGTMHPKHMGKQGDQLIRAFDEAADLIVVQHCNQIANSVVRMAESLAYDLRRPRRYCIIDGADTALILKAYGKLPPH